MTAEEHALLLEYLVELGQLDPETTPAEQAFDFEVWYSQRHGQVSGEVYYKHILDGAKVWKRAEKAGPASWTSSMSQKGYCVNQPWINPHLPGAPGLSLNSPLILSK